MAEALAGYSGTPLWKKLGLKEAMSAAVLNPPAGYMALLTGTPAADWGSLHAGISFIHIFTPFRAELEQTLRACLPVMARDGMIWVSWPKKSSKLPCDYTEDTIREICLPMGLVDVKVCAVSKVWSGLKLMIRRENR